MNRKELIKEYIEYYESQGCKKIGNASLVPENDPTVLFTTAGMQPLVPFILGQKHPQGRKLVNVQRCIRTGDIEEVGDDTHNTFFEMLGSWSLGDYWKEEAINYSYELYIKIFGLDVEKFHVTCFEGNEKENIPKDEESARIWKDLGIPEERIHFLGMKDNFWGPAGKIGPCGPDTEMFIDTDKESCEKGKDCRPGCNCGKFVEIGNNVFIQYNKTKNGEYEELDQKTVDTGMGVERDVALINGKASVWDNEDIWGPVIKKIEMISQHSYGEENKVTRAMRIIADHLKAACFILNDGVVPSNTEQGYVLRRLIRRAIRFGRVLGIEMFTTKIADIVIELYDDYKWDAKKVLVELQKEEERFLKTLEQGLRVFEKLRNKVVHNVDGITKFPGDKAFLLYQSYGFPIEMTKELGKENGVLIDMDGFNAALKKHQELSRTATAGKFSSGLADHSQATTRLHTATHLLLAALNEVLEIPEGLPEIQQKGSNITAERARFDFSFDRKLTEEEVQKIEDLVNQWIATGEKVKREEMNLEQAKAMGAKGIFEDKYTEQDVLSVYIVGDGSISKELCTGPHVQSLKELQDYTFRITKQKSVGAGARRVKVVLEKK